MTMKCPLIAALTSIILTGSLVAQSGGVAILDIDAVARELGVEDKVRVDLITMEASLKTELQRTQATMQSQMQGVEKAAGENPSEEQKREILVTNQQLNSEFTRLKGQASQNIGVERARMINEFRIRLEPVALMAAKKMGLDVVLMKVTPPVFTYSTEIDITEETIKLAIEAGMKIEIPTQGGPEKPSTEKKDGAKSEE